MMRMSLTALCVRGPLMVSQPGTDHQGETDGAFGRARLRRSLIEAHVDGCVKHQGFLRICGSPRSGGETRAATIGSYWLRPAGFPGPATFGAAFTATSSTRVAAPVATNIRAHVTAFLS